MTLNYTNLIHLMGIIVVLSFGCKDEKKGDHDAGYDGGDDWEESEESENETVPSDTAYEDNVDSETNQVRDGGETDDLADGGATDTESPATEDVDAGPFDAGMDGGEDTATASNMPTAIATDTEAALPTDTTTEIETDSIATDSAMTTDTVSPDVDAGDTEGTDTTPLSTDTQLPTDTDTCPSPCCTWEKTDFTAWTDISADGTALTISDDGVSSGIPIGFDMNLFFDGPFNTIQIVSNGFVYVGNTHSMTSAYAFANNTTLSSQTEPNGIMAVLWNDLVPDTEGGIYYLASGDPPNREFTVQWNNVKFFGSATSTVTMQLVLSETGSIIYRYIDFTGDDASLINGASGTIGIENEDGTLAVQHAFNEADSIAAGEELILNCVD